MTRNRIHVMHVTFGMGIGGMERMIMDLCRYIDPERYRFSICCLSVRGPLADQMEAEGVPVIFCENQSRVAKFLRGIELGRILRISRVQIIHSHNATAFFDGAIGARLAGVPIQIHTDHCKQYPVNRRLIVMEKASSLVADEVVAVSRHTREELIRYEGIAPGKVSVIQNGLNLKLTRTDSLEEMRREIGLSSDERVIGTVGRLEDQKGLDLLLDAIPRVRVQFPNARFVIVGGGSRESELRRRAGALGVADAVLFTGWRDDAEDLMQLFDCFVLTSKFEGLPIVLLEAMALSKPIVATAVGGIPELIQEGVNGVLVHSRDAGELSKAILGVLSDSFAARQMGRNGRLLYERSYTAEAMAASYEGRYRKYLEKKKVAAS